MSFLNELVGGVTSDVLSAVSERLSFTSASKLIEACCQELGWEIDERPSASRIALHFNDPVTRVRTVLVSIIERGTMVSFTVGSAVTMPAKEIPANVLGYMLERNSHCIVAWQVSIGDDGSACFAVNYLALTPGLNPGVFGMLCQCCCKRPANSTTGCARPGCSTKGNQPGRTRFRFVYHHPPFERFKYVLS